ncbi:MAG TPA: 6-carboxytetrahydropterin synthase [Candidatus Omnitrophota bacterium]|nr:6-carboxytetrahydropterin synthase [Candidatus Omnitrophota bacterium]
MPSAKKNERYLITVEARFEAAHHLRSYYGKPEPLHGHSWRVEAKIESRKLDREAISVDYVKVRKRLEGLAQKLDYGFINRIPPFDRLNPTSENIAKWFYEKLSEESLPISARLKEITLWEGPFHSLTYRTD